MSVKNYFLPQSLDEALALLGEQGDALLVMSGGTVAMPLINEGVSTPENVMGLRQTGLDYVRRQNGSVAIGATTTISQMVENAPNPILREAARNTAAWSIRNLATVGGNFFVPPPAGDFATALLALDATVKLVNQNGERFVPVSEFYTGFLTTALRADELLAEVLVNVPAGKTAYIKYGRKQAQTPAVVTIAAQVFFDGEVVRDARIALNAVGPHPVRVKKAEQSLVGSVLDEPSIATAAQFAADECEPFTDAIASEWYRRKMVNVFVGRALEQIAGEEG